jgi:hypothetical protein
MHPAFHLELPNPLRAVSSKELLAENKGFSTALTLRHGSTIRFGHESAASDP